jgi:hypothetical protein
MHLGKHDYTEPVKRTVEFDTDAEPGSHEYERAFELAVAKQKQEEQQELEARGKAA